MPYLDPALCRRYLNSGAYRGKGLAGGGWRAAQVSTAQHPATSWSKWSTQLLSVLPDSLEIGPRLLALAACTRPAVWTHPGALQASGLGSHPTTSRRHCRRALRRGRSLGFQPVGPSPVQPWLGSAGPDEGRLRGGVGGVVRSCPKAEAGAQGSPPGLPWFFSLHAHPTSNASGVDPS